MNSNQYFSVSLPKTISSAMYERDNWHCRHCNRNSQLHPHHVVFKSAGGSDELNNLLTLCAKCHRDVHEGRLAIWVETKTPTNLVVRFVKQEGWKP
jgi:HNH endonuclease